jgi:hypothetical protein
MAVMDGKEQGIPEGYLSLCISKSSTGLLQLGQKNKNLFHVSLFQEINVIRKTWLGKKTSCSFFFLELPMTIHENIC